MVFYVSGDREAELLIKALSAALATCTDADRYERLQKMLARALTCREKQGKRKAATRKDSD